MPKNPQCTFSPTALRHYLHYNVTTEHLNFLPITTTSGIILHFSSLKNHTNHQLLDYHEFTVVIPKSTTIPKLSPIVSSATSESPLTRLLVHQQLGHNCDKVLDTLCHQQSLLDLPKYPFPPRKCSCIISITTKTVHPPRAKITSVNLTKRGQLLHIDFSFWNIVSIRGFTSLLSVIDGKDRMLWNSPTASKHAPLQVFDFLFAILAHDGIMVQCIRVDEDGTLANSSEFCNFILQRKISLETTGGYASFLNGKIERHHRTIAQMVRSMLLNSGLPNSLWCFAAEAAADMYRYTYHSALQMSPYKAWYGTKPHINNLRVWGCYVYVRVLDPKKLDHRVTCGHFLGFTKSRLIVQWYNPSTQTVKHASAV
jgi:hypothetical protein